MSLWAGEIVALKNLNSKKKPETVQQFDSFGRHAQVPLSFEIAFQGVTIYGILT